LIAYLDSSVLLRIVLTQPDSLPEWNTIRIGISSELLRTESHRTLDRMWLHGELNDSEYRHKRRAVEALLNGFELVELDSNVLTVASAPLPVSLGTLDAIHLATALIVRSTRDFVFATHDKALARAAREMALDVIGT
jgi:uncharacterized protein